MLSKINGGAYRRYYALPTSVFVTKNIYLTIEEKCIVRICQHALENILNVSQGFIKLLHQPTKTHGSVGHSPNRHNGNKEAYDSIDTFLHRLKNDIGVPIATRYVKKITGMTTDYNNKNLFLPYHTSNNQYCTQW